MRESDTAVLIAHTNHAYAVCVSGGVELRLVLVIPGVLCYAQFSFFIFL
jgi:hypothetical protein